MELLIFTDSPLDLEMPPLYVLDGPQVMDMKHPAWVGFTGWGRDAWQARGPQTFDRRCMCRGEVLVAW